MSRFNKEGLYNEAMIIFEDEKDAYAIINEYIPEGDKLGDVENIAKRFKCWLDLGEIRAFVENPLDVKLEKIHEAKEKMYKQFLELIKRTDKMQNQKEINDDSDNILMKMMEKDMKNKKNNNKNNNNDDDDDVNDKGDDIV